MLKKLKKFGKKCFYKLFPVKQISKIHELVQKGNVVLGENSDVTNFNIFGYSFLEKTKNVIIGNDCLIHGQIELQSNEAEVIIGNRVFIGPNTKIFCRKKIEIEDDVMISWGCTIIDTNAHSLLSTERLNDVKDWKNGWENKNWDVVETKSILIESKSWIGFNSIITKGVILKSGCIVGSGSVVTKSFDEFSIIGGNPAKLIKYTI
jgi:acetyltransferase-like isoleucine patch superfamily enzyme